MKQFDRFQQLLEKEQEGHLLSRLKDEFDEKPFYKEYKNSYQASKIGVFLFHGFSLLTGSFFMYYVLLASTGLKVLSAIIALLALGIMEYCKHEILPKWGRFWVTGNRKGKLHLQLVNLSLIVISVFMSVEGARHLLAEAFPQPELKSSELVEDAFRREKEQLLSKIRQIEEGHTYKKRVAWQYRSYHPSDYLLSDKGKELVLSLNQSLKDLETQKRNELSFLKAENSSVLSAHQAKLDTISYSVVGISVVNELLCIAALFFGVFYRYRMYQELSFFNETDNARAMMPLNHPKETLKTPGIRAEYSASVEPEKESLPIGFQMEKNNIQPEQVKPRDYLKKWSRVVDEIEKGASINQIVRKFDGEVSRSTVMNVKRVWKYSVSLS